MENQELEKQLTALEEYSRQQLKYTRLQCLFSLISLVCCVIVVVLVFTALPRVEAMVTQAEDILGNLEVTTRELAGMDVTSLAQQMQSLLTNVDSLAECPMLVQVDIFGNQVPQVSALTAKDIVVNYDPTQRDNGY